jgi:hypothetical protein
MTIANKVKRASRSRTIVWGHIQFIAGAVTTAAGYFNPLAFPGQPVWVYGAVAMGAGVITYVLRAVTRKPLDEK